MRNDDVRDTVPKLDLCSLPRKTQVPASLSFARRSIAALGEGKGSRYLVGGLDIFFEFRDFARDATDFANDNACRVVC